MTELFEWPPVRSQRAKWALEELQIDYASTLINLPEGQQNTESYRAIHPLGVVPALKTETYTMFESVAIVLQLIDEHPEKKLAPAVGSPQRARYYQWCVFACAELDPAVMMYFNNTMRPSGAAHDANLAERGKNDFAARADMVSKVLSDNDHMLGSDFSGADILIGHSCFMAKHMGLIRDFPVLESYYGRLQQRPAYKRAYGGGDG